MLTLVTAELPGVGGSCRAGDRTCEEILAKQPAHTGNHHWLKVAKTGIGTQQVRAAIARSVGIEVDLVSCGGNRDREGRCIQWFSVPGGDVVDNPGPLRRAGTQGKVQVLELTSSHKPVTDAVISHLRWQVRILKSSANDGYRHAKAVMDRLRQRGLPNYIPLARFGDDGVLVSWGRQLAHGKRLPRQVAAAGTDAHRCLRAYQEWLFDVYVSQRIEAGCFSSLLQGDLVQSRKDEQFIVTDPAQSGKRLDSWDIVQLGPLFGAGLMPVADAADEREAQLLSDEQLGVSELARMRGDRRAIRVQPGKVLVDIDGADLVITCDLPTHAHIATLLAEVIKTGAGTSVSDAHK